MSQFCVYVDGIFDLAHPGHTTFLEKAYHKGVELSEGQKVKLLIGVCDEGVTEYKREPVMSAAERAHALRTFINGRWNAEVLEKRVPLTATEEFLTDHKVNLVVHGDDFSQEDLDKYYGDAQKVAKLATVPYSKGVSTTAIITEVKKIGKNGFRLKGIDPAVLTPSAETLASRIQERSWKQLNIDDPQTAKSWWQKGLDWIRGKDHQALQFNYEYGKQFRENPTLMGALGLNLRSIASALAGGVELTTNIVGRIAASCLNQRNEMGNLQLLFARTTEVIKDLAGSLFSGIVGAVSPDTSVHLGVKSADSLPKVLTPELAADLYAVGKKTTDFLDRHGIDYRMTSGTFLGAIRNNGIIPHDDDIDLFLHPDSKEKLSKLIEDGTFKRETGLAIRWNKDSGGWQTYFADGKELPSIMGGTLFPFVDLFCTTQDKDGRFAYESGLMHGLASQEYYTQEEWEQSKLYRFGPIQIRGPMDPSSYFKRCFGIEALDFAYQTVHHFDFKPKQWPQRVWVEQGISAEYDAERYEKRCSSEPTKALEHSD